MDRPLVIEGPIHYGNNRTDISRLICDQIVCYVTMTYRLNR